MVKSYNRDLYIPELKGTYGSITYPDSCIDSDSRG